MKRHRASSTFHIDRGQQKQAQLAMRISAKVLHVQLSRRRFSTPRVIFPSSHSATVLPPWRMAAGKLWTRQELFVALNLYHKLTFGQLHARQPAIVALAKRLGRGANSLAMKLSNFASLDPALKLRGIKGLEDASNLDRVI